MGRQEVLFGVVDNDQPFELWTAHVEMSEGVDLRREFEALASFGTETGNLWYRNRNG